MICFIRKVDYFLNPKRFKNKNNREYSIKYENTIFILNYFFIKEYVYITNCFIFYIN